MRYILVQSYLSVFNSNAAKAAEFWKYFKIMLRTCIVQVRNIILTKVAFMYTAPLLLAAFTIIILY